ncbi:enoyl-CoA hydratase-related protein [Roseateles sp. BYS180W]|uniref:Enoyl-CoA hydratase-related protein n=1 Tax=Roseateles rivi TaxID=3299028 RepID=A0ABW7FYI5_9BURK
MTFSPQSPSIATAIEGGVCHITLNRPEALNAFTAPMLDALAAALQEVAANEQVRALVLTGAGRAFSAGQDLQEPLVRPEPGVRKDLGLMLDHYLPVARALRSLPVPTVCAVNGVAAGAGANLALGCDIVLAAEGASFIQAFSKIGLIPDCGGTWLLPRLVGRAKALELALLGDKLSASEAARLGLIARCVPAETLAAEALGVAQRLAALPTSALVRTRALVDAAMDLPFDEALSAERTAQSALGQAHDYQEGVQAFLDKRAPRYADR